MDKPTTSLLAGVSIAILGAMISPVQTTRLEQRLESLHRACIDEGTKMVEDGAPASFILTCDPVELATTSGTFGGTQQQVAVAQNRLWTWQRLSVRVPLGVAGLLALPWAWYFLLRRVRELRDAVTGQ